jgi:hypothetical protein
MTGIFEWLQGKKTYIIVVFASLFNIGVVFGWWTPDSQIWTLINAIFGFLGLGTIRSGIKTEAKKVV